MTANVGIAITDGIDDREVMNRLSELMTLGKDPAPVMKAFGDYKVKETVTLFEQERDPDGRPWPELSPLTRKYKKNPKILSESTDLRNSIYKVADAHGVRVGTNKVYAAAHQLGFDDTVQIPAHRRKVKTRSKKGVQSGVAFVKAHEREAYLVERRFLGFTDGDRLELVETVKDYLEL